MNKLVAAFAALMFTSLSFSQKTDAELSRLYDTATIRQISEYKYAVHNKVVKRKKLGTLLLSYPESALAYKQFKKKRLISSVIWISSGISYFSGLFVLESNPELATGLVLVGAAGTIATLPFALDAQKMLYRSIWLYNRSVMTGAEKIKQ